MRMLADIGVTISGFAKLLRNLNLHESINTLRRPQGFFVGQGTAIGPLEIREGLGVAVVFLVRIVLAASQTAESDADFNEPGDAGQGWQSAWATTPVALKRQTSGTKP